MTVISPGIFGSGLVCIFQTRPLPDLRSVDKEGVPPPPPPVWMYQALAAKAVEPTSPIVNVGVSKTQVVLACIKLFGIERAYCCGRLYEQAEVAEQPGSENPHPQGTAGSSTRPRVAAH